MTAALITPQQISEQKKIKRNLEEQVDLVNIFINNKNRNESSKDAEWHKNIDNKIRLELINLIGMVESAKLIGINTTEYESFIKKSYFLKMILVLSISYNSFNFNTFSYEND